MPITYEASIERITEIAPETRSFTLRLPETVHFTFVPGQFISSLLPVGDQTIIRPYSIASSPEEPGRLEIVLNRIPGGPGSTYLFGLRNGDSVRFTGPWGTFTLNQQPSAECVFVADGTGVVPIRPMLRRTLASGLSHALRLHHAAADSARLLYADEFRAAADTHPHFTFEPLLAGALTDVIAQRYVATDQDRSRHFYICGVGAIVPQLRDLLRRAGYERRAVHYEKW